MAGKLTNAGLVKYAQTMTKTKTAYMWGGLMQPITANLIKIKANQYPKHYTPSRKRYLSSLIGLGYGCDCVGLIKSYWFGGINSPYYDNKKDVNTTGLYNLAPAKGKINAMPEIPGLIVYMSGHVGVYIGNGKVIECTQGRYGDGVVETNLRGRGWTHWLKCPYIDYPQMNQHCVDKYFIYTVKAGDTLWRLAKRFYGSGLKYPQIAKYNGIKSTSTLRVGQKLKIEVK